jgi:hypothetical protein
MSKWIHQSTDIWHLIISFLEYTPHTARLGRTCHTLDRIPNWYERSGHTQPHDRWDIVEGTVRNVNYGICRHSRDGKSFEIPSMGVDSWGRMIRIKFLFNSSNVPFLIIHKMVRVERT